MTKAQITDYIQQKYPKVKLFYSGKNKKWFLKNAPYSVVDEHQIEKYVAMLSF